MRSTRSRVALALGAALLGAIVLAPPAGAVDCSAYPSDPSCNTTTTTTVATTTTTTEPDDTTTTTEAPPPQAVTGSTTNPTPEPGDTVPIAVPALPADIRIDPSKPAAVVFVPADGGADVPAPAAQITQNADGSQTIEVVVPDGTPPGVYIIAVVAQDADGNPRVVLVPVVVQAATSAAGASASGFKLATATAAFPREVRAELSQVTRSIDGIGGEAAVVSAVVDDGARLAIENGELSLLPATGSSATRPIVAAIAVMLAGAGLLLIQRRLPAISKRSR